MSNSDASIFIITHAPTGSALLQALSDILPTELISDIHLFEISPEDIPEKKIEEAKKNLIPKAKEKVLILTDLIGATPYNIARKIMQSTQYKNCALITGISLPMLIKTANYQHFSLDKWVAEVTDSALEWIIIEFKRNNHL